MVSGAKQSAALSQLPLNLDGEQSSKRFRVDTDSIEMLDDDSHITRTTYSYSTSAGSAPLGSTNTGKAPEPFAERDEMSPTIDPDVQPPKRPHRPPSQDFLDSATILTMLLMLHEYDTNLNTPCHCGRGLREAQCQDCQEYELSCTECWIQNHVQNPWHWARIWNGHFFVRSDISTLRDNYAVQLGHHGHMCPTLDELKPVKFTVTHSNGVHGTRLSFCNCGRGSRVEQLMRARLFPASIAEPETAFTFTVMREYDIHSLQGKIPAYDYFLSLRRLSDNVHTDQVNVSDRAS